MKQRDYSLDCQDDAIEIKLRAERRLGKLIKEMEKRNGGDATKARLHLVTESHCLFRPWLEQSPGPPMAFPMHRDRNSSTAKGRLLRGTQSGIQAP
jgi:hypothetical protein